jgi:hypothetical protein
MMQGAYLWGMGPYLAYADENEHPVAFVFLAFRSNPKLFDRSAY